MKKEYDYVYAIIRIDNFLGPDCPIERKVTVKEIVWDSETARGEVERLNALRKGKEGVLYFSQVTRLLPRPIELPPSATANELLRQSAADQPVKWPEALESSPIAPS